MPQDPFWTDLWATRQCWQVFFFKSYIELCGFAVVHFSAEPFPAARSLNLPVEQFMWVGSLKKCLISYILLLVGGEHWRKPLKWWRQWSYLWNFPLFISLLSLQMSCFIICPVVSYTGIHEGPLQEETLITDKN